MAAFAERAASFLPHADAANLPATSAAQRTRAQQRTHAGGRCSRQRGHAARPRSWLHAALAPAQHARLCTPAAATHRLGCIRPPARPAAPPPPPKSPLRRRRIPADVNACVRTFLLARRGMSTLRSVSARRLKFITRRTSPGASTSACASASVRRQGARQGGVSVRGSGGGARGASRKAKQHNHGLQGGGDRHPTLTRRGALRRSLPLRALVRGAVPGTDVMRRV
jgi:hypothetical protein